MTPRLVGTSTLTLRSSAGLPESDNALYPAVRAVGSRGAFARLEPISPVTGSKTLEGKVSSSVLKEALSNHYLPVMLLDTAIINDLWPDTRHGLVPAQQRVVYYETSELASPKLITTTANTLPTTVTISLPKYVATGYPGFSPATFKATASVKGRPDIRLMAMPNWAAPGLDILLAPADPFDTFLFQHARSEDLLIAVEVSGGHTGLPRLTGTVLVPRLPLSRDLHDPVDGQRRNRNAATL